MIKWSMLSANSAIHKQVGFINHRQDCRRRAPGLGWRVMSVWVCYRYGEEETSEGKDLYLQVKSHTVVVSSHH